MLVSAILSGHLPPGAPVPSSRHGRPPAHRAQQWCSLTSSWSARAIWCRASAAISSAIRSCRGICKTPRRAMARPPQQRRPMTRAPRAGTSGCAFDPRCNAISSSRATGRNSPTLRLWPVRPRPVSHRRMARVLYQGAVGAGHPQLGAGPHHPRRPRADRADPHPGAAAPGRLGRRVRDRHHRGCAARALLADLLVNDDTVVGMEDRLSRRAQYLRQPHPPPAAAARRRTRPDHRHPAAGLRLSFVTPGHQCPTSVTLSRERRDSLLPWPAADT